MLTPLYPTYDATELAEVSADMTQNHEAALMNISVSDVRQWLKTKGSVGMGMIPRGDASPQDWTPTDTSYKAADYWWDMITPWFVVSKGVGHTATNTRVNISEVSIQIYDTSIGAWHKLTVGNGNPTWGSNKDYSNGANTDHGTNTARAETDGSKSIAFIAAAAAVHGGTPKFTITDAIPDRANVGCVFVTMTSKLVLDDVNGVDDRHLAQILMCVAADYWPRSTSVINPDFLPMTYVPNVGIGRFGLVGVNPRRHYMSTITPPTVPTNRSVFTAGGGVVTMPKATFDASAPPYIGKNNRFVFTNKHGPRPWVATPLSRATYFVSPTGSSGNPGTFESPKDLQSAINATVPGDVIFMLEGTYSVTTAAHLNLWQDGTATNPIIYEAYPGHTVIIDGSGITPGVGTTRYVNMSGSWQKLRGVTVQNMPEYGIYINGNHNVIDGCTITGNRLSGIICYTSGSGPWTAASFNTIMNCWVHHNSDVGLTGGNYNNGGNADGIAPSRGQNNAVLHNLVEYNSDDGIDSWISWGTKIQYNIVRNNGLGIGNGNGIKAGGNSQGKNAIVDHNLVYNNLSVGIDYNTGINVSMISNTTYGNATGYGFGSDTINQRNVSKSDTAVKYGTGIATRNSWGITGTLTLLSTTEGDADFLQVTQDSNFNGIGAHYL